MRLSSYLIIAATFGVAGALSLTAAGSIANVIEDTSELAVRNGLDAADLTWAEVHANGLQVYLTGTAPSEADRFKAVTTAGHLVDAARVIDQMDVASTADLAPPRFSIEILRNDDGLSLIGLIPTDSDRDALLEAVRKIADGGTVSDLLQTADYDIPEGWQRSVDYALGALKTLPRSKISIEADRVAITAMTKTAEELRRLETELSRKADMELVLDLSAPRPVLTPFTLRLVIDDGAARFDACSADSDASAQRIVAAAKEAGLDNEQMNCTVGLGVPSPRWAEAAEQSIKALAFLGAGSVTFNDADISLVAELGTDQAQFDRVVGELENTLPAVFSLHSDLPKPTAKNDDGDALEFTATLSPEGQVQLRGRINDELSRTAAESYAVARFGNANVHTAARLDKALPKSWSLRVLTSLEALSLLSNGFVSVTPDVIRVQGNTGRPDASAQIAGFLAERLNETQRFDIDVTYLEKLDPIASLPTPEECETQVNDILKVRKINFEPGSDTPDASAQGVLDDIAAVLKACSEDLKFEIGGHTDSQGRESMNQALSQARAAAVLSGLRERRLLTSAYRAVGYGESQPIADNGTEDGREANRRIEFKLIRPAATDTSAEDENALDAMASEGAEAAAQNTDKATPEAEQTNEGN
ncbi:OmpA family protein [Thalassobius sp. Cn5-15]|uniref:OmpA family protein n=1 Tax=Thalassobius sp. Cn5-15 TaxID=2917763 RepID=UPI001EF21714|nr:OmpA family protein [Thalassobius sp. Cn5-15]MCG7493436.1 OmpA family protein [Thalassobius sp. Cn5-15]